MPDEKTRLKLYEIILARYKALISEKETKNISEIRQRCSPYNDFIKNICKDFTKSITIYEYDKHFLQAVGNALEFTRRIENVDYGLTFSLSFEEILAINASSVFDKSVFLCTLLRSLGSETARVVVTRQNQNYVLFEWGNEKYSIKVDSCSLLAGEDFNKAFHADEMLYAFNDLTFESYEE